MLWSANANTIKPGAATLNVAHESDDMIDLSNSLMWAFKTPMFKDRYYDESYEMRRNGNIFSLDAPVKLEEEIVGILFEYGYNHFGIPITINQDTPTNVTIYVNDKLEYTGSKSD